MATGISSSRMDVLLHICGSEMTGSMKMESGPIPGVQQDGSSEAASGNIMTRTEMSALDG